MNDRDRSDWSYSPGAAEPPPIPPRGSLRPRDAVWLTRITVITAVGLLGWEWAAKASKFTELRQALEGRYSSQVDRVEKEETEEKAAFAQELHDLEETHRARISDPAIIDGSKARELHNAEWTRRLAHEPQLAQSLTERSLLEMEQLGADKKISARAALERVAALASPPGSRVEVTPVGNLFAVKVAYRMGALTTGEIGAATKHRSTASMRAEVQRLSTQVTRDLFTYCGSRGISSIALTCNHTLLKSVIPAGATPEEKEILHSRAKATQSKLHRVVLESAAARNISNWSRASNDEIQRLMRVDFDAIDSIQFTDNLTGAQTEAEDPLLF